MIITYIVGWLVLDGWWFMVLGSWFMVCGLWSMLHGSWLMRHRSWFMMVQFFFYDHPDRKGYISCLFSQIAIRPVRSVGYWNLGWNVHIHRCIYSNRVPTLTVQAVLALNMASHFTSHSVVTFGTTNYISRLCTQTLVQALTLICALYSNVAAKLWDYTCFC